MKVMKTNKILLIACILFFTTVNLRGQAIITLSTARTAGGTETACQLIELKPGFSFTATSSASLTLTVNPSNCDPYGGKASSASSTQNYIRTKTYTTADGSRFMETNQYFDGLGRPVQTVQRCITPATADLVTYLEYDQYGREDSAWLGAVASGNNGAYMALAAFKSKATATYNNTTYNAAADSKPNSYPVYEPSPLNRVLQQYGPGADWQNNGKSIKTEYQANSGTTGVLSCALFTVSGTGVSIKVNKNNFYPDKQLYVTKTTDEDGNLSYEFKDKLGQVILTRQMLNGSGLDTYYVYDDFGNLCFVLPPLASSGLSNGTYDETNNTVNQYAYIYKYDSRNRCIAKKLPGCEWIYNIYDSADRLVFTQDGENRKAGVWQFFISDALGRVVLTGTCKNTYTYSANPLNTAVVKGVYNSSRTNLANSYTISGVTLTNPVILTANFYGNYSFMGITEIPNNTNTQYNAESEYDTRYTGGYNGMLTGTVAAQMNSDGTISSAYLYSVMYYDNRGRVVQIKSNNSLAGGIEKEYIAYSFTGKPTAKKHIHQATGKTTQTEVYAYQYDHAGRLIAETHQLNTGPITTVAENTYDELGRLKTNKKGMQDNLKTTYAYNIRSWIKSITSPLFTETLYYNESYGGSTKSYSGNLSAMSWKLSSEANTRGYAFSYNNRSWLTAANYLENGAANTNYKTAYTYDNQGNIKTLQRYGKTTAAAYGLIDNLTINYTGNRLLKVEDAVATISLAESTDLKNYSNTATEYTYNANGAMTKDLNKGISDIQYNLLNLPRLTDIKSPVAEARNEYTYSASGQKLKLVQKWNPNYSTAPVIGSAITVSALTMNKTTDYIGGMIYENGTLKRILIDGGYIEGGVYYYYLNDRQGNNRLVADANSTVVQKNHYYPFGMSFADGLSPNAQPYKYNGKESDQMHGLNQYDYSARYYDPSIVRFTTVDPMTEKYYSMSPYAYCLNNPVRYTDPTGMSTHTDSLGYVLAVYNDDDLGIYRHDISHESYDGSGLKAKNGTRMGRSLHTFSFIDFDAFEKKGTNIIPMGRIDFDNYDAMNEISSILDQDPTALDLYRNAGLHGNWDLKDRLGYYNGSVIAVSEYSKELIYASGRDAGNFLAGAIADRSSISDVIFLTGFGAYNQGKSKWLIPVYLIPSFFSKTFGEDKLSYEGIIRGMTLNRTYFPRR